LPSDNSLWFLTQNPHKYNEARAILASQSILIRHLSQAKTEVQGSNPEEIAKFALETALKQNKKRILVEDSGLFVEDLDGFPGPYSSYALETIGLKGVLTLMKNRRDRRAYFQASVAYGSPYNKPRVFTGKVIGRISQSILGETGFGYDPIFIPNGSQKTFGQSTQAFKNARSHRAKAFLKFAEWFQSRRS
jgi:XTP/dITP diphosphohydrolase